MTFTEIRTEILEQLALTSTAATTRIGRAISRHYKLITAELGLAGVSRRTTVTGATVVGSRTISFANIEKIEKIQDLTDADNPVTLDEKGFDEIDTIVAPDSDDASRWATERMGATTVLVRFDVTFESIKTYTATGYTKQSTLASADVPAFPETFHHILVEKVMYDELRKKGQLAEAKESRATAEDLTSKLRMWVATSAYRTDRQGGAQDSGGVS